MGGSCSPSESKRLQLAIANPKLIRIKTPSPAPGYEIEIHELEGVLALLEKFALLVGLNKLAARFLQLEFCDTTLAHELQLEPAGLCGESLCSVLGVEVVGANAVNIAGAAYQDKIAKVRLVCQYAPEKVNDKGSVMLLIYTLRLTLLWLWDSMGTQPSTQLPTTTRWGWQSCFWELERQLISRMRSELAAAAVARCAECVAVVQGGRTALHLAARNNRLEVAQLLLGAGAPADAKDTVSVGCS